MRLRDRSFIATFKNLNKTKNYSKKHKIIVPLRLNYEKNKMSSSFVKNHQVNSYQMGRTKKLHR